MALGKKTQSDYLRHVKNFTLFLGRSPDQAQPEDLRLYQAHQHKQGVQPPTMKGAVAALRFFFTTTCNRPEMARHLTLVRQPQKLPVVLTLEEVARLIEAAPGPKYKAALGVALRVSEVATRGAFAAGGDRRQHVAGHRLRAGPDRAGSHDPTRIMVSGFLLFVAGLAIVGRG